MFAKKALSVIALILCLTCLMGCNQETDSPSLDSLPAFEPFTQDKVSIVNKTTDLRERINTDEANRVLEGTKIDVYYDNSSGCFYNYAKPDADSNMKDMFQRTMRSIKSACSCAKSYSTYLTQGDAKQNCLVWKPMNIASKDIFDDYANMDIYTPNMGPYDYKEDKSPIVMWLDKVQANVKKGEDADKNISIYLSDLNENGGCLAPAGKMVKNIINSAPEGEIDFMIISYTLPYTGTISGYSLKKDGNSKDKDVTYTISGTDQRNYYILAFGSHKELSMLSYKITEEGFKEIEKVTGKKMNATTYMYKDIFYGEKSITTFDSQDKVVKDADFINNTPPVYIVSDSDGKAVAEIVASYAPEKIEDENEGEESEQLEETKNNDQLVYELLAGGLLDENFEDPADTEKEKKGSLSGDVEAGKQLLPNLQELTSEQLKEFIKEEANGTTSAFKYVVPLNNYGWKCSYTLSNPEYYRFDVDNAEAFVYVPESNNKTLTDVEDTKTGWVPVEEVEGSSIQVSFDAAGVTVGSEQMLGFDTNAVVVSIPVVYDYYKVEKYYEIKQVDQKFIDWVTACNVPEKIPSGKEYYELTHTVLFDEFMDKITDGYKNISESGQKKEVKVNDPQTSAAVVDRLNVIIVAESNGGGLKK